MNNVARIVTLIVLLFAISFTSSGQTKREKSGLRKNVLYGSFGYLFMYFSVEGGYQRMIWENQKLVFNTYWVRAGMGGYADLFSYTDGGPYYIITLGTMTGSKSSHFECHFGMTLMYNKHAYEDSYGDYKEYVRYGNNSGIHNEPQKSDFYFLRPAGSIGYRFQKPGSHFSFRAGVGYPESIFVNLGFVF